MCICLCLFVFVYLFIFIYLFIYLSTHLFIYLFTSFFLSLFVLVALNREGWKFERIDGTTKSKQRYEIAQNLNTDDGNYK
jgi:hypothetical protein